MTDQDSERSPNFQFRPRGMGNNWLDCFICGHKALYDGLGEGSCNYDMASFVSSKEDGESIVRLFEAAGCTGAMLDYRPSEPTWIQVKVGACFLHWPSLALLGEWCRDGKIDQGRIERCLPKPNPVRTEDQLAQLAVDRAKMDKLMQQIQGAEN